MDAPVRARRPRLVQGHGPLHARRRHRRTTAGSAITRGRGSPAPLHHALRVGAMTTGRAVGPRLRRLLVVVLAGAALLFANSIYLAALTFAEWTTGRALQNYF